MKNVRVTIQGLSEKFKGVQHEFDTDQIMAISFDSIRKGEMYMNISMIGTGDKEDVADSMAKALVGLLKRTFGEAGSRYWVIFLKRFLYEMDGTFDFNLNELEEADGFDGPGINMDEFVIGRREN